LNTEPINATTATKSQSTKSAITSMEPVSIELLRGSRKSQPPKKSTQELQPRKDSMEQEALAIVTQLESRGTQRTAAARERQQGSQTRNAGGVHIGNLEVRIMPPAAPPAPIIRPQQARQAPATVLSRSFTSSLGLNQG
jgi:hypothetical protein